MGRAKDKDGGDGGQSGGKAAVKGKKAKKDDEDPFKSLGDKIRNHKDLESRWAVLRERRVEYFRGKDFANFIRHHSEIVDAAIELGTRTKESLPSGLTSEEQVASLLLRRRLIIRCDRVNKVPRPGKKRLSSWPRRLDLHGEQLFTEDDGFFAWTYDRSTTLLQTLMSFLVPVLTIGICLFPVFPYWFKLGVLYTCLTFLGVIFSLLTVRGLVFGILWVLLGKRIWFFPNILAEEASFAELCRFLPDGKKDEDPPPKWTERVLVALLVCGAVWLFVHHAPDENARAKYSRKAKDKLQEWLEWNPSYGMLAGNKTETAKDAGEGGKGGEGGEGGKGEGESGDVDKVDHPSTVDREGVLDDLPFDDEAIIDDAPLEHDLHPGGDGFGTKHESGVTEDDGEMDGKETKEARAAGQSSVDQVSDINGDGERHSGTDDRSNS
ncbi:hypothetical protein CBR_g54322 [Chara braunii]|uniref:Translocation protein SEC62 n=1 Tax=Chara braunii TaxID=69332 RepID=A0A388MBX3_CHABU|nr:hypothetical protein CBR_g54322 [Chara braunii]|eukprot:GBG92067.1 hypothetical protein CBR_g54322 [Chara braunii]